MLKISTLRVAMLILILFPGSFSKIYENAESLKEGLFVASVISALLLMATGQAIAYNSARLMFRRFFMILLVVILHGLLSIFGAGFNLPRFVLSIVLFLGLFLLWIPISQAFLDATSTDLDGGMRWCYWMLLLDGLISSFWYQFGGLKSTFFAAEPSHFALTFLPFLFYMLFRDRSLFHLAAALTIAMAIGNLTLLVGLILILGLYFRKRLIALTLVLVLGAVLVSLSTDYSNYLVARLNFDTTSANLSGLIFMSGYERAYTTIVSGHWLGVGFQQMGFVGPAGDLLEYIALLSGGSLLNLYDGGSMAAKLSVEFGLIGIALLAYYLSGLAKVFFRVDFENLAPLTLLCWGIYTTFACFLFVRGTGYFSTSVLLFLVANFHLATGGHWRLLAIERPITARTPSSPHISNRSNS